MHASFSNLDFLRWFFYVILKRKWMVILLFLSGIGLAGGAAYMTAPTYKAIARILVHMNLRQVTFFKNLETQYPTQQTVNPASNMVQVATGQTMTRQMVEIFDLDKRLEQKETNPQEMRDIISKHLKSIYRAPLKLLEEIGLWESEPPNYFAEAIEKLRSDIEEIELEAKTEVINITIWGETPELSMQMANKLAEMLVATVASITQNELSVAHDFAVEQIALAETKLEKSEDTFQEFRQTHNIADFAKDLDLKIRTLNDLGNEHMDVKIELVALEEDNEEILRQLDRQIQSLSSKKTYSDLVDKSIQRKIRINSLRAKEEELRQTTDRLQAEASELVALENSWNRLWRDKEANEKLAKNLQDKVRELEVEKVSQLNNYDIRIVDRAFIPEGADPDWPDWQIFLMVGAFGSLSLALGVPFLVEFFRDTHLTISEMEEALDAPALGLVPACRKSISRFIKKKPRSGFLAPYLPMAESLCYESDSEDSVYLITSAMAGEGKSVTALGLSEALRKLGREVVVIDANLRNPSMSRRFNVEPASDIEDLLDEMDTEADTAARIPSAKLIKAGRTDTNPLDLLKSENFHRLLEALRKRYQYILIDSPNVGDHVDSLLIAPRIDGVILVVQADKTSKKKTEKAKLKIEKAKGTVRGLVLNRARFSHILNPS
ncbi:MAG: formate--tetrahydrofolate ligase [Candidatus Abyssubacteria bacterium]|nr:formate--tetrahydrofolate ligase [Candidatus Abyssubacteria bacterium]